MSTLKDQPNSTPIDMFQCEPMKTSAFLDQSANKNLTAESEEYDLSEIYITDASHSS